MVRGSGGGDQKMIQKKNVQFSFSESRIWMLTRPDPIVIILKTDPQKTIYKFEKKKKNSKKTLHDDSSVERTRVVSHD